MNVSFKKKLAAALCGGAALAGVATVAFAEPETAFRGGNALTHAATSPRNERLANTPDFEGKLHERAEQAGRAAGQSNEQAEREVRDRAETEKRTREADEAMQKGMSDGVKAAQDHLDRTRGGDGGRVGGGSHESTHTDGGRDGSKYV